MEQRLFKLLVENGKNFAFPSRSVNFDDFQNSGKTQTEILSLNDLPKCFTVSQKVGFSADILWQDCDVDNDVFQALPTGCELTVRRKTHDRGSLKYFF